MKEEARIGSDYIVNLVIDTNMEEASRSDELKDAVDYVKLLDIVKEEMSIRSKLLEHVAQRIIDQVIKNFARVDTVDITVAKQNPPIKGDIREVSIRLKKQR
tara:strand:- start:82 stop:387 length:306 start_codon:yes stop_codon:yes gene_type:complete